MWLIGWREIPNFLLITVVDINHTTYLSRVVDRSRGKIQIFTWLIGRVVDRLAGNPLFLIDYCG